MEIKKHFQFIGNLKKVHEEDKNPIENLISCIKCYMNGDVFIEIDALTNKKINKKKFHESIPRFKFKNIPEDKQLNLFSLLQLASLEKELLSAPYEGDYKIEGKTPEGWNLTAIVAEAGYSVSFGADDAQEKMEDDDKTYLIRLQELCIDYEPQYDKGKTIELKCGLANIQVLYNFSVPFLDSKAELSIVSVESESSDKKNRILSVEMILKGIDENERHSYNVYYAWFESLLSFASGHNVRQIYSIETIQTNGLQKEVEYWSGHSFAEKGRGIAVIQQPHLHLFIQNCANKVTWDNFSNKSLGLALRWYINAFNSSSIEIEFLLLCTVLETLNKKYSTKFSKRLISKSLYKQIRERILNIINNEKQNINDADILYKYEIFKAKVENSFSGGSYNQIGNLRTSLTEMLEFYKVPYKDLFPELEFIKIRDKIVHEGFGGAAVAPEVRKLSNLVVRIVLSILEYQGDYMESIRIEIVDESDRSRHGLMCRHFPFPE